MSNDNDGQRAKLARTWLVMADAVLRAIEAEEPSAASLEVARKWLEANGCTLDTIRNWRAGGLGFDPKALPTFDDDDRGESGSATAPGALKLIPPFTSA